MSLDAHEWQVIWQQVSTIADDVAGRVLRVIEDAPARSATRDEIALQFAVVGSKKYAGPIPAAGAHEMMAEAYLLADAFIAERAKRTA